MLNRTGYSILISSMLIISLLLVCSIFILSAYINRSKGSNFILYTQQLIDYANIIINQVKSVFGSKQLTQEEIHNIISKYNNSVADFKVYAKLISFNDKKILMIYIYSMKSGLLIVKYIRLT